MRQTVTAHTVASNVLEPALDAVALQALKRRLIHRPETPQADSVVEVLAVAVGALRLLERLAGELAEANGMQLPALHTITGYSDRLVAELHDEKCNGDGHPSGRKLAGDIIRLLDEIDGGDPIDGALALTDLFLLFGQVTEELLFRDAVTYILGVHRTGRLRDMHSRYLERRGRAVAVPA